MLEKVFVKLENHDFVHEVRALIKQFFPMVKIIFIQEKALVENQGLLIENILKKDPKTGNLCSFTKVSKDEKIISDHITYITDIDIKVSDDKRITKLGIKKSLFKSLESVSDTKVPWGVLTGIRPTKVVHELMDLKISEQDVRDILTTEYLLHIEKANLILDIASRERRFIYPLDHKKFSLYISIPFCPTRCLYCSFPSNDISKCNSSVDQYTEKLIYEISEMAKVMNGHILDTVYIGGGTPTAIPIANLKEIIEAVYEHFGTEMREFTVEAGRPDTIDKEVLQTLKALNIERISINPQSMNDKTLETIGRRHSVRDIVDTFLMAREVGFKSINMDLILGLPDEDQNDVKETINQIMILRPENLTVHTMSLKRTSDLSKDIEQYSLTGQKMLEEMIEITKDCAKEMNLNPYYMYRQGQILGNFENVGYALEGHECIYNMLIMEEKQTIIALGAGATSKVYNSDTGKVTRVPNVKNLKDYLDRVDEMIEKKRSELDANKSTKRN